MFPAVIPVAGVGTRSLPASKAIPKEMLPLFDKPIIQYIVEEAVGAGVQDVIFVTSKGKTAIEDHFDISPDLEHFLEEKKKTELLEKVRKLSRLVRVQSVRQKEALGLGHAVGMASRMIRGSHFFVFLGDEVTDADPSSVQQLLNVYESLPSEARRFAGVVMLMKVADEDVSKYGICEIEDSKIKACVEKPKPSETKSRWAITGRYLLPVRCFEFIENQQSGKLGEIQLTDALDRLAAEDNLYPCYFEGKRFDAGDRLGFLDANIHFYLKSELQSEVMQILRKYV